jgi:hypothetical protein
VHVGTLAFTSSEGDDIVASEPKEARSSNQAIRMADSLATTEGHCGTFACRGAQEVFKRQST